MAASRRIRIAGFVIAVAAAVVIAGLATVVAMLSHYVTTESADRQTAARAFDSARQRMNGQEPLIEYRETPFVHRDDSAPRRPLSTLNVLTYDAEDGELKRAAIPARVVELVTLGGRLRLMNLDTFGDGRDRITLEDLERHGPGLVLDLRIGSVPQVAVANLVLGRTTNGTRLMVWTD
jgi:hypothetical protein